MAWVGSPTLKSIQPQLPAMGCGQGVLQPDQAAQSPFQPGLEHLRDGPSTISGYLQMFVCFGTHSCWVFQLSTNCNPKKIQQKAEFQLYSWTWIFTQSDQGDEALLWDQSLRHCVALKHVPGNSAPISGSHFRAICSVCVLSARWPSLYPTFLVAEMAALPWGMQKPEVNFEEQLEKVKETYPWDLCPSCREVGPARVSGLNYTDRNMVIQKEKLNILWVQVQKITLSWGTCLSSDRSMYFHSLVSSYVRLTYKAAISGLFTVIALKEVVLIVCAVLIAMQTDCLCINSGSDFLASGALLINTAVAICLHKVRTYLLKTFTWYIYI